jgi:translation elongation factor P/translation initiation factor 5A
MKAGEIKKGNVIEHNGTVYQVRDIERSSPQGRGGNVKFRFTLYSVPGGVKFDLSCGADDELREMDLSRRMCTFSYKDGEAFVFLDAEDYTPYQLDADVLGDEPIWHKGKVVGWVTSGGFAHYVDRSMAQGYVPVELAGDTSPGAFEIEIIGDNRKATIITEPPFDPEGKRMRG